MAPTLTRRSTIELAYPYSSPTVTAELPAPVFENEEKLEQKFLFRRTRGLVSKIFRDSNWPSYTTLTFICQGCSTVQRAGYLTLVSQSLGDEIRLTDYESRTWRGILIPGEITDQLRSCGYVIEFQFQGTVL
jgi:hypothetical protein